MVSAPHSWTQEQFDRWYMTGLQHTRAEESRDGGPIRALYFPYVWTDAEPEYVHCLRVQSGTEILAVKLHVGQLNVLHDAEDIVQIRAFAEKYVPKFILQARVAQIRSTPVVRRPDFYA